MVRAAKGSPPQSKNPRGRKKQAAPAQGDLADDSPAGSSVVGLVRPVSPAPGARASLEPAVISVSEATSASPSPAPPIPSMSASPSASPPQSRSPSATGAELFLGLRLQRASTVSAAGGEGAQPATAAANLWRSRLSRSPQRLSRIADDDPGRQGALDALAEQVRELQAKTAQQRALMNRKDNQLAVTMARAQLESKKAERQIAERVARHAELARERDKVRREAAELERQLKKQRDEESFKVQQRVYNVLRALRQYTKREDVSVRMIFERITELEFQSASELGASAADYDSAGQSELDALREAANNWQIEREELESHVREVEFGKKMAESQLQVAEEKLGSAIDDFGATVPLTSLMKMADSVRDFVDYLHEFSIAVQQELENGLDSIITSTQEMLLAWGEAQRAVEERHAAEVHQLRCEIADLHTQSQAVAESAVTALLDAAQAVHAELGAEAVACGLGPSSGPKGESVSRESTMCTQVEGGDTAAEAPGGISNAAVATVSMRRLQRGGSHARKKPSFVKRGGGVLPPEPAAPASPKFAFTVAQVLEDGDDGLNVVTAAVRRQLGVVREIRSQRAAAQSALREADEAREELKREGQQLRADAQRLSDEKGELVAKISAQSREHAVCLTRARQAEERSGALEKQIAEQAAQMQSAQKQIDEMKGAASGKEMRQLEEQLAEAEAAVKEQKQKISAQRELVVAMRAQLAGHQKDIARQKRSGVPDISQVEDEGELAELCEKLFAAAFEALSKLIGSEGHGMPGPMEVAGGSREDQITRIMAHMLKWVAGAAQRGFADRLPPELLALMNRSAMARFAAAPGGKQRPPLTYAERGVQCVILQGAWQPPENGATRVLVVLAAKVLAGLIHRGCGPRWQLRYHTLRGRRQSEIVKLARLLQVEYEAARATRQATLAMTVRAKLQAVESLARPVSAAPLSPEQAAGQPAAAALCERSPSRLRPPTAPPAPGVAYSHALPPTSIWAAAAVEGGSPAPAFAAGLDPPPDSAFGPGSGTGFSSMPSSTPVRRQGARSAERSGATRQRPGSSASLPTRLQPAGASPPESQPPERSPRSPPLLQYRVDARLRPPSSPPRLLPPTAHQAASARPNGPAGFQAAPQTLGGVRASGEAPRLLRRPATAAKGSGEVPPRELLLELSAFRDSGAAAETQRRHCGGAETAAAGSPRKGSPLHGANLAWPFGAAAARTADQIVAAPQRLHQPPAKRAPAAQRAAVAGTDYHIVGLEPSPLSNHCGREQQSPRPGSTPAPAADGTQPPAAGRRRAGSAAAAAPPQPPPRPAAPAPQSTEHLDADDPLLLRGDPAPGAAELSLALHQQRTDALQQLQRRLARAESAEQQRRQQHGAGRAGSAPVRNGRTGKAPSQQQAPPSPAPEPGRQTQAMSPTIVGLVGWETDGEDEREPPSRGGGGTHARGAAEASGRKKGGRGKSPRQQQLPTVAKGAIPGTMHF